MNENQLLQINEDLTIELDDKNERIAKLEMQFEDTIDFLNDLYYFNIFGRKKEILKHLLVLDSSKLFDFKVIDDKD